MSNQLEKMKRKPKKMIAKDKGMEYWFENVMVSFPHLDEPSVHPEYPSSPSRYSLQVILTPEEALKFTEKVKEHIVENNLPMPNPFVFEAFKIKSLDGDSYATEPRLYNNFSRTLYSSYPLAVGKIEDTHLITIEKHKIKEEISAGSICLVHVLVKLRQDDNAKEGEYSIYPKQVIKVKDGESLGGGATSLGQGLDMTRYGVTEIKTGAVTESLDHSTPSSNEEYVYDYKINDQKEVEAQMEDLVK